MGVPVNVGVAAAGAQRGVGSVESGIAVESVETTNDDPKFYLLDIHGQRVGFAHAFDASRTMTISGEITGSSGVMSSTFGTDSVSNFANIRPADEFQHARAWSGGWYLDTATVTEAREAWLSMTASWTQLESIPGGGP